MRKKPFIVSDTYVPKAMWDFKDTDTMKAAIDLWYKYHNIEKVLGILKVKNYNMIRGLEYEPVIHSNPPTISKLPAQKLAKQEFIQKALFSDDELK